jgi:hypothetical protein
MRGLLLTTVVVLSVEVGAHLIVMSTRGFSSLFLGSVAAQGGQARLVPVTPAK